MFLRFWRSLREKTTASPSRRAGSSATKRIILRIESLESRDLLSGFTPSYLMNPISGSATPYATMSPTGYSPSQISQAYGFNQISFNDGTVAGNGSGQTIAIVDAYNQPNIASDLHAFDVAFGLPDPPSLAIVNQNGGSSLPVANSGWGTEISLDVEWAHAMAPGAKILLVEANSSSEGDLLSAVQYAAAQPGVSVVSMSWGGGEFSSETHYDSIFTTPAGHQGVAFIASSGDSGAPVSYPAASPNVLAVGGTGLYLNGSSYGSESGWGGSTGGVSVYEAQPSYQNGVTSQSSTQRTSPDVSYDANPNTGFSVYDSYGTSAPWQQVGGTSAGAPQWAALVAIADQGRALNGLGTLSSSSQLLPMLYQLPSSDFHDVTSGSSTGSPNYSAGPGYDLVTGLGSPYADRIVAALSGQTLSNDPVNPPTSSGTSSPPVNSPVPLSPPGGPGPVSSPVSIPVTFLPGPQASSSNLFAGVANDALFLVQGWESQNDPLLLMGWEDFVSAVLSHPSDAQALEQALLSDMLSDLI